jgi:lysozyme
MSSVGLAASRRDWSTDGALLQFMSAVEGVRKTPYADTKGFTSIGIGRNLTGKGLDLGEVQYLYRNDVQDCSDTMDRAIPWWRRLNDDGQRAMVSLCFMGWGTFQMFHEFLLAMEHLSAPPPTPDAAYTQLWIDRAHAELKASLWWSQVGERGPKTLALIHP